MKTIKMKKIIFVSFLIAGGAEAASSVTVNIPTTNIISNGGTGTISNGIVCPPVSRVCLDGQLAKMTLKCREICPEDKKPLKPSETVKVGQNIGGNQAGFFIQAAAVAGMNSVLDLINGDAQGALQNMTNVGATMESARNMGDGNFQKMTANQLNDNQLVKVAEKLEDASGLSKKDILSFVLSPEGGNNCNSAGTKLQGLIKKVPNTDAKEKMEKVLDEAQSEGDKKGPDSYSATGCKGDKDESGTVLPKVKEEKSAEEKKKEKIAAEEKEAAEKAKQAKLDVLNAYKSYLEAKNSGLNKEKRAEELEELNLMMDEVVMAKLDNANSEANDVSIFARVKVKYRILTQQQWLDIQVLDIIKDKGPKK